MTWHNLPNSPDVGCAAQHRVKTTLLAVPQPLHPVPTNTHAHPSMSATNVGDLKDDAASSKSGGRSGGPQEAPTAPDFSGYTADPSPLGGSPARNEPVLTPAELPDGSAPRSSSRRSSVNKDGMVPSVHENRAPSVHDGMRPTSAPRPPSAPRTPSRPASSSGTKYNFDAAAPPVLQPAPVQTYQAAERRSLPGSAGRRSNAVAPLPYLPSTMTTAMAGAPGTVVAPEAQLPRRDDEEAAAAENAGPLPAISGAERTRAMQKLGHRPMTDSSGRTRFGSNYSFSFTGDRENGVAMVLSWKNLSYFIPEQKRQKTKKEAAPMKQVLFDINGEVRPGEMIAIMGASGMSFRQQCACSPCATRGWQVYSAQRFSRTD